MNEKIPYIERLVDLNILLDKKSHFLLGPRQAGKTFSGFEVDFIIGDHTAVEVKAREFLESLWNGEYS